MFNNNNLWQILGGIAQLIAAVYAINAFKVAKKERKEKMNPTWEVEEYNLKTYLHDNPKECYYIETELFLRNIGYGSARNVRFHFDSDNGGLLEVEKSSKAKDILPDKNVKLNLKWNIKDNPKGVLRVFSNTRLGIHEQLLVLKTYNIDKLIFEKKDNNLCKLEYKWEYEEGFYSYLCKLIWFINFIKYKIIGFFKKLKSKITNKEEKNMIDACFELELWVLKIKKEFGEPGFLKKEFMNSEKSIVTIREFVSMFGGINVPPTADELKYQIPEYVDENFWYRKISDWIENGIIKEHIIKENKNILTESDYLKAIIYALSKCTNLT